MGANYPELGNVLNCRVTLGSLMDLNLETRESGRSSGGTSASVNLPVGG